MEKGSESEQLTPTRQAIAAMLSNLGYFPAVIEQMQKDLPDELTVGQFLEMV